MKSYLLLLFIVTLSDANAQWSGDSTLNLELSDSSLTGSVFNPKGVSNGSGGAIVVWQQSTIYGQHINSIGDTLWGKHGISVGTSRQPGFVAALLNPVIISDDSGGAIIAWMEYSQHAIGASRVRQDGSVAWDELVCYTTGLRANPAITSDGSGGAIITWQDTRNGTTNADIYAQRMSIAGAVMWDSNGVVVCTAPREQEFPTIASDSNGGAFITWQDNRILDKDIYAQRINSLGQLQWESNGIPVCATSSNPSSTPKIVATDAGEAIITWVDGRSGGTWDIYAAKVNLDTTVWAANGVAVCNAPLSQTEPAIVADGFGGAIVSWSDTRVSFSDPNIYAQNVAHDGLVQWTVNGIPVCTLPDRQVAPSISSDGKGGAIIAWEDYRSGTYYDVYAQRVNHGGSTMWTEDGKGVCLAPRDQRSITVVGTGDGGALIAWQDYRNNARFVIYGQGVDSTGSLGITTHVGEERLPEVFSLEQNYPNPFNPITKIRFGVSGSGFVSLKVFNLLGKEIVTLVSKPLNPGSYEATFDGNGLPSGMYFYKLSVSRSATRDPPLAGNRERIPT